MCNTWVQHSLTIRAAIFQRIVTCLDCKVEVIAYSLRRLYGGLKVVDVSSRELGRDVPSRTAEDRVDEVVLLKQHALVVRTLPSVVERENTLVLFCTQVCSFCLPTHGVVFMGCIEGHRRSSACVTGIIRGSIIGETKLLGDPRQGTRELCVHHWVFAVLEKTELCSS